MNRTAFVVGVQEKLQRIFSMKVQVKLFSILREYVPDYDTQTGVEVELAANATVAELLNHLGLPLSKSPVVSCNGRILQPAAIIPADSILQIFQPVAGG
jgi:sulfur carrier protein ThiS